MAAVTVVGGEATFAWIKSPQLRDGGMGGDRDPNLKGNELAHPIFSSTANQ